MNNLQPLPPPQTLPVPIFTIPSEIPSIPTTTEAILNPIINSQAISTTATLDNGVTSSIQSEPTNAIQQPLEQRQANAKRNAAESSFETAFICIIVGVIRFII